jgi:hypothetical protein
MLPSLSDDSLSDELCTVVLGELMQLLMSRMLASGVAAQDIVRRITQDQAVRGSRFSEFKEVMMNMVESHSFELSLYETVVALHSADLIGMQKKRMTERVRFSHFHSCAIPF